MFGKKYLRNLHTNLIPAQVQGGSFRAKDSELEMCLVRQTNWITGLVLLSVCVVTFLVVAHCLGTPPDVQ